MYTKEEVFNIRHNDYKITPMDEKIYEELGYVLHQADKPFGRNARIVYKEAFGTILNQRLISLTLNGNMSAERWYLNNYGDKDYEELELTDTEKKLLQLKHKELCEGYWSVPK